MDTQLEVSIIILGSVSGFMVIFCGLYYGTFYCNRYKNRADSNDFLLDIEKN